MQPNTPPLELVPASSKVFFCVGTTYYGPLLGSLSLELSLRWAKVKEKANVIVAELTSINLMKQKEEPVVHTPCGAAKVLA